MELKLKNAVMSARVNPLGAELKSLSDEKGREYIWDGSEYWKRSSPLLFPIVGSLNDKTVLFGGKPYHMGQHGFARDMEWTVANQSKDSVTLSLNEDASTLEKYPFPFALSVRYTLVKRAVKMEFTVRNTGKETLPYCFGTHPAIRCPFEAAPGSVFSDYRVEFEKDEIMTQPTLNEEKIIDRNARESFLKDPRTLIPDYAVFERVDTVIFDEIHSKKVRLIENASGKYIEIRFDDFTQMGFWTPKAGAPFLCIEPWNGCAAIVGESGNFEDKLGARSLEPGKEKTFTLEIDTAGCTTGRTAGRGE